MSVAVYLVTPPFTQLNTAYPATAYLKGFLNTRSISSFQSDLGIEVILQIFSKDGLEHVFNSIENSDSVETFSENIQRILALRQDYIRLIEPVISFLQGSNSSFAQLVCNRDVLPEAERFAQLDDLSWAFGSMGIQDKAKHLCTLFIEDLADLIKECLDPHFGFSRYAEQLARSANSFKELSNQLNQPLSYIDEITLSLLQKHINEQNPQLVALSVPFPGNLLSALRCGQWIKKNKPEISIVMGGGFPNTELRSLKDAEIFNYVDFISLDDGETPMETLLNYLNGALPKSELKRMYFLESGLVHYVNNKSIPDYRQSDTGTPDYSDLLLDKYISAIEVANPMHRLWSDGRWNKLTMAHGCYWGKCTFCDISLDYIRLYEPVAASQICDRIESLIKQTGETGFHFVDEAAPPALMRAVALEIIRRKLVISWWTNIRFEKSFTEDLCFLLKASGCIAVSGGLEVASDRLLKLINKGITVEQVARVTKHFTKAGIMVHAYLMYGFPTQTAQETIDSLEMVRQMFALGILQSAFWHRFTMTAHSPVGLDPAAFQVISLQAEPGTFANNDVEHDDPKGTEHELFSFGLKKSLHNYMHSLCFDKPLQSWFEHKVPKTSVAADFIMKAVDTDLYLPFDPASKIIWLGKTPERTVITQSKKGNSRELMVLQFETVKKSHKIQIPVEQGKWFFNILEKLKPDQPTVITVKEIQADYELAGLEDFELFWDNKPINTLSQIGLLKI